MRSADDRSGPCFANSARPAVVNDQRRTVRPLRSAPDATVSSCARPAPRSRARSCLVEPGCRVPSSGQITSVGIRGQRARSWSISCVAGPSFREPCCSLRLMALELRHRLPPHSVPAYRLARHTIRSSASTKKCSCSGSVPWRQNSTRSARDAAHSPTTNKHCWQRRSDLRRRSSSYGRRLPAQTDAGKHPPRSV
jgi:hypothetical protein